MLIRAKTENRDLVYRTAPVNVRADGPATIDEETRSVEVVLATEQPVAVYDWDHGVIDEVLLMSGAQIPAKRKLVMLDAHSRYATGDIIGSAREITTEGEEMVGRAVFSAEAESQWVKVKEGHLTDFSIGYRVNTSVWVPENQEQKIAGRIFKGPLRVVTKWTPRELSAVPIGADELAKTRSTHEQTIDEEVNEMDAKLRAFLERSGLSPEATEAEAWEFLESRGLAEPEGQDTEGNQPEGEKADEAKINAARAAATGAERTRINEIDALCARAEMPDEARALILDGTSVADAQRKIMDKIIEKSKNPGASGIVLGMEDVDKFRAAATDSLYLRAGLEIKTPVAGAEDLRGYTLVELARECLRMAGRPYSGHVKEMVGRALTSSDFPNILANLATKSMQEAWDGSPETWPVWCGVGSVSDFKTYYDNALSEHDDLEEVPDSGEVKYGKFTEKDPETYKAATYAKKFRFTRVMIINDDLGAFTELPTKRTEAAARKVGDVAYAVLTANGTMGDGETIFSDAHANQAASGYMAGPGVSNIGEGIRAMGVQKDIAGLRRLNIRPQFFLGPKALEGAAEVFFRSEKFADSDTVATDSSLAATRANPYSGNYFTRVYEPRLDDNDEAAWYLAGPKGKTIKVVFLNGRQGPNLEVLQPGFSIEGIEYLVSIDVGAYAVDYRGLYYNAGE